MNAEILKALKEEIEKWEMIIDGKGADDGSGPLCDLFPTCMGCPVIIIGKCTSGCQDPPYRNWLEHQVEEHAEEKEFKISCPTCKELAQKELDFLRSLLPKERK
ncbi:MAG: hypothetical protein ACTSPV_00455 [Candidatus Hodarchaeales archaeon]